MRNIIKVCVFCTGKEEVWRDLEKKKIVVFFFFYFMPHSHGVSAPMIPIQFEWVTSGVAGLNCGSVCTASVMLLAAEVGDKRGVTDEGQ